MEDQQLSKWINKTLTDASGRIYTVHPNKCDCFYLQLLLINVHYQKSFPNLRTVNGELCATYGEGCQHLHFLEHDTHWDYSLRDAVISSNSHQIRTLFPIISSTCFPSNPIDWWTRYKDDMSDDILHQMSTKTSIPNLHLSDEIHKEALILVGDISLMISNKLLPQSSMSAPHAYDTLKILNYRTGRIFFFDAPGGTENFFSIALILATIRSQNGIASHLLMNNWFGLKHCQYTENIIFRLQEIKKYLNNQRKMWR